MSSLPAAGYLTNAARTEAEFKTGLDDWLAATKQIPGAGVAETTLTIATGSVTPTTGVHSIDTEAAAATDDLTNIVQTNLPDGSLLIVRCVSAARVIAVKHSAGGAGQISLVTAGDVTLGDPSHWLLLKRTGALWEEIARFPQSMRAVVTRTSNTILRAADIGKLIDGTSGTFSQTFEACATLGKGWWVAVKNSGSGVVTLDPNASETIDGATTLTLNPGDEVMIVCDGSSLKTFARYVATVRAAQCGIFEGDGVSAPTALYFRPFNGNKILINGAMETIPSAGIALTAGDTTNTFKYVYAYMTGSAMTLEKSVTGYVADATYGHMIKIGDATRSLVGAYYTDGAGGWQDNPAKRLVLSWFNQAPTILQGTHNGGVSTASTIRVDMGSAYWVEFICWVNGQALAVWSGYAAESANATDEWIIGIGFDGTLSGGAECYGRSFGGATQRCPAMVQRCMVSLAEGYHKFQAYHATSAGTVTSTGILSAVVSTNRHKQ